MSKKTWRGKFPTDWRKDGSPQTKRSDQMIATTAMLGSPQNCVITLARHGEYDFGTHELTANGRDTMGHLAEFLMEQTGLLEPVQCRSTQRRTHLEKLAGMTLPPVDAILHSGATRTAGSARIVSEILAKFGNKRNLNLGSMPWLAEGFYPEIYKGYNGGTAPMVVSLSHFRDCFSWLSEQATSQGLRHIVLVTHHPAIRALVAGTTVNTARADSTELYNAEHSLRENTPFGVTVVLGGKGWKDFTAGSAHILQQPFLPTAKGVQLSDAARTAGFIALQSQMQMAK